MAKKKKQELKENEEYRLSSEPEKEEDKKEPYIKLSLSPEMETKIAKIIMDEVDNAKGNKEREVFIKHCDYCRKRFTMEDMDTDWPWENASKRRTGRTTISVDRLKPRVKRAFFSSGHIIGLAPLGTNTDDNADKQEMWLDSTLRHEMKLEDKSDNIWYDAIMLNFGVIKLPWVHTEEKKEEVTIYETPEELVRNYPDVGQKHPNILQKLLRTLKPARIRERFKDTFDGIDPEWIDPKDFILPKGVIDDQKSWIVIQHLKMRRDELIKKQKSGFFDKAGVDAILGKDTDVKDYGKEYDIYEAILKFDIDNDKLEEKCVYWAGKGAGDNTKGNNIFLRGIKYPYTHGRNYMFVIRSTEHRYGYYTGGMGAKLKSINIAEDSQVNQIDNAWKQHIVSAWKRVVTPNSPYDPLIHKYFPGAIIPVASETELTEMSTKRDIPRSSLTLLEDNRREGELLSAMSVSYASGQAQPQDPSAPAKKAELLLAEANVSMSEYVKNMAVGIREIGHQVMMVYYQMTNTKSLNYRTERGTETISKQEMRARVAFSCKTAVESVMAEQKARSYLGLLNALGQHPLVAQNYPFQWYLIKTIVTNWSEDFARNIDKLFSPQLRNLIIQQQQQADALAQQEAQEEEYKKQRKSEGGTEEMVNIEIQRAKQGQGQGQPQGATV